MGLCGLYEEEMFRLAWGSSGGVCEALSDIACKKDYTHKY